MLLSSLLGSPAPLLCVSSQSHKTTDTSSASDGSNRQGVHGHVPAIHAMQLSCRGTTPAAKNLSFSGERGSKEMHIKGKDLGAFESVDPDEEA